MTEQIAKIKRVFLGIEDHGIFTCQLYLDYGGSAQTAGGYALDEPRRENGEFLGRFGTAFGMEWIKRLMAACGVEDFSKIEGRTVMAIREDDGWNSPVIGISPLPTERGERFDFEALAEEYHPKEAAA